MFLSFRALHFRTLLLAITMGCPGCFYLSSTDAAAQVNPCTGNTPVYSIDLSGNPNATWVSAPPIARAGSCCGSSSPDRCIVFLITLDSAAVAINFEIIDGAMPGGSMYYQIDCGPLSAVGEPICLNGPGPYALTFCKPGNNLNTYAITSMSGPPVSPDQSVGIGCSITLSTYSLDPATVTWTDITSGNGLYNAYLSCTSGCLTTVVTPANPAPPYVDYVVCGSPLTPACMPPTPFCDTIRVNIVPNISVSISPDPAIFCANFPGIQLTGTVSGGDGNYTYLWTGPGGTPVGDSLNYYAMLPGTYALEVQDASSSGCSGFDTVTVTEQSPPTVNAGADMTICETVGSITLNGAVTNASGGLWSGGAGVFLPGNTSLNTTYIPTPAEISTGYIVLTLTSTGNGLCPPATDQILISFSPDIGLTIAGPNVVCYNDSVNLIAVISGGLPPFSYFWSTGDSTHVITAGAGTYYVSVSDASLFPCVKNAVITVTENPELTVNASPDDSIVCDTITQVSVSASGGTGNYTYLWQNGQTTPTVSVTPGTYQVSVTDGAGCTAVDIVTVTATNSTLTASVSGPQVVCYGEISPITASATGGLGFYNYLWDNGMTTNVINVGAGDYCVLITDLVGCRVTACTTIEENPPVSATISGYTPTCAGSNIPITAYGSGGQAPYTYLWNTGQITQSILQPSGTYSVTVTDANSCSDTASLTVYNEDTVLVTGSSTGTSCYNGFDGTATASVTGGIAPYFYSWSPWGGNGVTASGLSAGTYLVSVTDALGCVGLTSIAVTQPTPVSPSLSVISPSCFGGNDGVVMATASGGTPPYIYYWSPTGDSGAALPAVSAGTYSVLVTDAMGCTAYGTAQVTAPSPLNATVTGSSVSCTGGSDGTISVAVTGGTAPYTYQWSPGVSTTASAGNLNAGTYVITVIDSMGCVYVASYALNELAGMSLGISVTGNVTCFGWNNGQAAVSVSGGTSPFSYYWAASGETGPNASFLSAGNNMVIVSDVNGCLDSASVTITEPPPLTVTTSDQNILCDSTVTLTATVSGGSQPYSFSWSTGESSDSILSNTPGIYGVTVTDAQGCMAGDTVYVNATNSSLASFIAAPVSICNSSTAVITAIPSGGTGIYSYLWSTGDTIDSITVISGNYCVTVTDGAGCSTTSCLYLTENDSLLVGITPDTICYGSTGDIMAVVSGGEPPYDYLWSTGETTSGIVDSAGLYSITVTDNIGCETIASLTVSESAQIITGFYNVYNVSCYGGSNGTATLSVLNGYPPFIYQWTTGDITASVSGLTAGVYGVSLTDSLGCTASDTIAIQEPATPLALDSINGSNLLCFGDSNGTATVSASGGTAPFNYLWWWNGDTLAGTTGLPAGNFSVSAADSAGCTVFLSVEISQPPALELLFTNIDNITCYGDGNGSATTQVTGGTLPYTYAWSQGDNGPDADSLGAGYYGLTVTDGAGCTGSAGFTITEPAPVTATVAGSASICSGESTVISASATGGTGNLVYVWDNGLGNCAVQVVSPAVTTVYTIIVTDSNGCSSTAQSVTVNVSGPLTLTSGTSDTICQGDSTAISVIASGGDGNYGYVWSDTAFGNSPGPHIVAPAVTTTYSVVVIDSCGNFPVSATLTVFVMPYPNAVINATPAEGCVVLNVTFTADTDGNPPGTTYLWIFDDGSTSNTTVAYQTYEQGGTYAVSLSATTPSGCSNSTASNGEVIVYEEAIADFTATPEVTSILNANIDFTNYSQNATSYTWSFGDGDSAFTANPQHTYGDTGTYIVMLIANNLNGCPDTMEQWITIEPDYAFFIPNAFFPGSNRPNQTFIGKGHCIKEFEMYIYDRWGDMIYETHSLDEPWDGRANDGKKTAQQDVYVYLIRTIDCAGDEHEYIGHVTLIR